MKIEVIITKDGERGIVTESFGTNFFALFECTRPGGSEYLGERIVLGEDVVETVRVEIPE